MCENAKTIKSNTVKYILFQMLYGTALTLTTGAVVQAFFEHLGLTGKTSLYSSVIQIFQVASMMACSLWCDRLKSIIKSVGRSVCVIGTLSIALILVCLGIPSDTGDIFFFILAVSCVSSIGLGIYNVLIYKLPYSIYDIGEFGKYSALCGIVSGLCGFACTSLISYLTGVFPYRTVILIFFAVGAVFFAAATVICFSFKKIADFPLDEKSDIKLLRLPEFTKLIAPNILRGIGTGIMGLITVVGIKRGVLDGETSVHVATLTVLGSMCGFLFYLATVKTVRIKALTLITAFTVLVSLPLSVVTENFYFFCVMYFIAYAAVTALGNCIPVLVYGGVPREIIGKYTAWRMLFLTLGSAIPGFFMNLLLDKIGAVAVLATGGVCTAVCGVVYVVVFGKRIKPQK